MTVDGITKIEGRKRPWRVRFRDDSGKKGTKHFLHELDARDWAEKQTGFAPAEDITPSEKLLLSWAREKCRAEGVSLEAIIQDFLQVATRPASVSLETAAEQYKIDLKRRNLRPTYVQNVSYVVDSFVRDRESWPVSSITADSVVKYCLTTAVGDENQDTVRRRLSAFLNWCREKRWTAVDTREIRWRRARSDRKRVGFYHPDQVEALLRAAPEKIRFPLALMFFTGVRPKGEITRLTFDAINPKARTIEISESTSKIRAHRTLYDLPDNLWSWYEAAKPKRGRVMPMTYRNFRAAVGKVVNKLEYDWPQDCSRHTFATCAFHRGLEWAIDIMGHRDSRLFLSRYKGRITPDEAEGLWNIFPL